MMRWVDTLEESLLALILALMVVLTFINVVLRYVFNSGLSWGLEATSFLFAWLVLLGASVLVKRNAHLGIDALFSITPQAARRPLIVLSAIACILYAGAVLLGGWKYWSPYVGPRAWYEVNDIPFPRVLGFMEEWLNEGEAYEKLPRFIPYVIVPIGSALLLLRFTQALYQRLRAPYPALLVASHEASSETTHSAPDHEADCTAGQEILRTRSAASNPVEPIIR